MTSSSRDLFQVYSVPTGRRTQYTFEDGEFITIASRRGRAISSRTSRHWDIELATRTDDGYALLAHGTSSRREGQYRIFFTNQNGEITNRSQWLTREESISTLFIEQNVIADADDNGIVDGSEQFAYQIYSDGQGITITDRRGRTFNDASNRQWDVIAAGKVNDGFAVLRSGTSNRRSGQYRLWFTTPEGRIHSGTGWESGDFYQQQGYESIFNIDLNNDGQIEDPSEPPSENDGEASILITGDTQQGGILSVQLEADDPDGNGDLGSQSPLWENSTDNGQNWSSLGSSETLTVIPGIAGSLIRARLSYVDGDGFTETIFSDPVSLPALPPETNDDFGDTPSTSGLLGIESTANGTLEEAGDRDWFEVNLTTGGIYNFAVIGQSLSDPYLRLYNNSGALIDFNDDHNGTLNSAINDFLAPSTGKYFLGVGAYNDAGTGTMALLIAQLMTS
ncbi:pre-peptidase C-terminal domain-containing protein [Synechococcus sp. A15-44]|uniref:pre-peptidase C-terminal domain-containing protein n=1 Tax=Synechococcus sp. A15-44 TaxID=1050646 RepID=UPI00164431A2|nr:pre-peptidase C-terminal domain-containing protein [Synechococcus sp. A15-44]QNI63896.1 subtilisin DY domain protein [Synechococcus sp. A15-44]